MLTVEVTDSATPGLTDTATITIDVGDLNEAPTVGDLAFALAENQPAGTVVGTVAATDPDAAAEPFGTLSYAITGGNAAGLFAIDAVSGAITTTQALDHEAAAQHVLTVAVTDSAISALTDTATITIDVGDVNEAPTGITLSASTVAEDAATDTIVGTLQGVVDPDAGDSHILSLMDSAGGRFKLVGNTLQVADGTLLDFEGAASHAVTVRVTDAAGLFHDEIFTVDITDVNEAPTDVALSANSVAEGAASGTVVGLLAGVVDPDAGDTHVLSLVDDAGGRFQLVGNSLQVADGTLLDFEGAASHAVTVRVTDAAGLSYDEIFTVNVTDVNEAPTDVSLSATMVGEGAAADTVVGMLQGVVDQDAGDSHTLSLFDDAGGRFKLVGAELQVLDGALLDFETATSHAVTVRVTDAAGLSYDKVLTIDVADVNEAPSGLGLSANTVAEGVASGTVVATLQGVLDPDAGDSHTFTLVDDAGGGAVPARR